MSENLGAVYLNNKWYVVDEILDSDCFEPGTRYVALSLRLDPDYNDEDGNPV